MSEWIQNIKSRKYSSHFLTTFIRKLIMVIIIIHTGLHQTEILTILHNNSTYIYHFILHRSIESNEYLICSVLLLPIGLLTPRNPAWPSFLKTWWAGKLCSLSHWSTNGLMSWSIIYTQSISFSYSQTLSKIQVYENMQTKGTLHGPIHMTGNNYGADKKSHPTV